MSELTTGGIRCGICQTVFPHGSIHMCGGSVPLSNLPPDSPLRSSREETPKDSPVPLDVEAARALLERLATELDTTVGRWSQRDAALLRSLASSLSGIADLKRDAERLDWIFDVATIKVEREMESEGRHWWKTVLLRNRQDIDADRLASDSGTGDDNG